MDAIDETDLVALVQKVIQGQQKQLEATTRMAAILSGIADQGLENTERYVKSLEECEARYREQSVERGAWKRAIISALIVGIIIGCAVILSRFL